jgi:hypothetical protein
MGGSQILGNASSKATRPMEGQALGAIRGGEAGDGLW